MKIISSSLLALGLVSLSAVALADSSNSFDYSKTSTSFVDNSSSGNMIDDIANQSYYGGSIGPSEAGSYCTGAVNCEDKDTAWKMFGGYRITDLLSAEASYISLGDLHKPTGTGGAETSDISAFTAGAVATLPVNEQFDIMGRLGVMRWSSENSTGDRSGFGMTYGVGAKLNLNERTKLRAEWEKLPGIKTSPTEKTDVNMMSIGVELSTY